MPSSSWDMRPLGDLADVRTEKYEPSAGDRTPYVALEHIEQGQPRLLGQAEAGLALSSKTRFQSGDILYGKLRPNLRKAAMAPFSGVCSTDILAIHAREQATSNYLLHVMHWPEFQQAAVASASGTKMPRTSWDLIRTIDVPVPPLPEQRRIAAILSSVDDSIEKAEAVIDQLEVVKNGLVVDLLTRGVPGRHNEFIALPEEWRLGRICNTTTMPHGWQLVKLTSVARLESGHTPSRKHPEYWDGDVPWVSLHDSKVLDVPLLLDTTQHITELGLENSSARMLPSGTVVFSRTATIGKCTVIARDMATSQDFANYICGEQIHNRYLMHYFRANESEWERLKAGSTHKTLYMPIFEQLQVFLPPLAEQVEIANAADACDSRLAAERGVVVGLKAVKTALLDALLSGRVQVNRSAQEAA
ncbi:restriction endonuclease subunit S [Corallococcus exiguus]|uniref:restriction endonuclease subunit S n=1 Tax=Corallococcus exiguus TaxID=83462 RepID=UPI001A8DD422|nr:restriction endonuclease subunit S [Corallococcus exiguus]MBN8465938.1 restriction endonuclease subunit S [Corallococcus exiguus]